MDTEKPECREARKAVSRKEMQLHPRRKEECRADKKLRWACRRKRRREWDNREDIQRRAEVVVAVAGVVRLKSWAKD